MLRSMALGRNGSITCFCSLFFVIGDRLIAREKLTLTDFLGLKSNVGALNRKADSRNNGIGGMRII